MVVTIDGPAASGKSITARLVAQKLGWIYLDTGAMYRAVTVHVLSSKISLEDEKNIGKLIDCITLDLIPSHEGMRILLNNREVTSEIRTPEVDKAVGPVCEVPRVREMMVRQQRMMADKGNLVAEGRDMGTVVFPEADLKFFMIASIEGRARRRQKDLEKQKLQIPLEIIVKEIKRRDQRDSERSHSPLKKAKDAIILDTTDMNINQQVAFVLKHIEKIKDKR
jgi:cytidylate kinase